jgi:hypothetical protein
MMGGLNEKLASSKWRALVRAGKLSKKSLAELKEMGLHGTPFMHNRERLGLERGTAAILRSREIPLVQGRRFATTYNDVNDPRVQQAAIAAVLGRKAETARIAKGIPVKPPTVSFGTGKMPSKMQIPGEAYSPQSLDSLAALGKRHEVDEARNILRLSKKHKNAYDLGRAEGFSSHISPRVTMEEAGHANFLHPQVSRTMDTFRVKEKRVTDAALSPGRGATKGADRGATVLSMVRRMLGRKPARVAAKTTAPKAAVPYSQWYVPPGKKRDERVRRMVKQWRGG